MISIVTSKRLKVRFATLIMPLDCVLRNEDAFSRFNEVQQLWGVHNKQLFLQHEMSWPPPGLLNQIEQLLCPLGLEELRDYVLVQDVPWKYINSGQKLPGTENCAWLEYEINQQGTFVWMDSADKAD